MLFYLLFPIVIVVLAFMGKNKPQYGYFAIILLFLFSVFRGDNVGVDTMNYQDEGNLEYIGYNLDVNSGDNFELLYILLMRYIYQAGISPRMIITFFSIITMLFLYLGLKRFRINLAAGASFFILLNFYYDSFNVARQVTAISILIYATSFLMEKGNKRYLFFIWLSMAAMFHFSTISGVIFWFADKITLEKKKVFLFMLIFSVICLVLPLNDLLLSITAKMGIANHYIGYLTEYEIQQISIFGAIFKFVVSFILLYVFISMNKRKKTNWLDNLFILSLLFTFFLTYSNMVTKRLIMNFSFIQIIYLSSFYFSNRKFLKYDFITLIAFLLLMYYDSFTYSSNLGKSGYYMQLNIF